MAETNIIQMQQQNLLARDAVVTNSVKMCQQIYSAAIDPSEQTIVNLSTNTIRNVGVLLGFIVEVSGKLETGDTGTANLTNWGTANMVRQFRFDDLSNFTRIQTSGRHLSMLNTVRQGFGYGGTYNPNLPMDYGDNYGVFAGPATIPVSSNADVRHSYYVPIAYSPTDLRGAIYMATTSGVTNLQIELNGTPGTNAGNSIDKVYTGNNGIAWDGNVTITVYQVYFDQIPRLPDGTPILPVLDLDTVYDIKETTYPGVSPNQDFPLAYSNYRAFLSTIAIYDNAGVFASGSDINYWALQSANFSNIFKYSPRISALQTRQEIMADMPPGTYLFNSRSTPINTIQWGNMELVLNASSASAGARVIAGYEAFARVGQLKQAGSLGGG